MRLVVSEHVDGLNVTMKIARHGGKVETLPLLSAKDGQHSHMSTVAPAEPRDFNATLELTAGDRRESLPFKMVEPGEHHH